MILLKFSSHISDDIKTLKFKKVKHLHLRILYYTPLVYYQSSTQLIPHKSILLSCEGDFARAQAILRRSQTPLIQQTWCGEYIQSSYLSQILRIIFVEKKLSCGEISACYTEVSAVMILREPKPFCDDHRRLSYSRRGVVNTFG